MPKRYRLLKDYPRAKAGTIVEEHRNPTVAGIMCREFKVSLPGYEWYFQVPFDVLDDWLEEVKEEATCSKEFAAAIRKFGLTVAELPGEIVEGYLVPKEWLTERTSSKGDRSTCCSAPVNVSGSDEGTSYYVCSKCSNPCDHE